MTEKRKSGRPEVPGDPGMAAYRKWQHENLSPDEFKAELWKTLDRTLSDPEKREEFISRLGDALSETDQAGQYGQETE